MVPNIPSEYPVLLVAMSPEIRQQKLSDVLVFSYFLMVVLWFIWVLIILKWLIKAPGHIAMRFFSMFETARKATKYDPSEPSFITEILQTYKQHFMKFLCCCRSGHLTF